MRRESCLLREKCRVGEGCKGEGSENGECQVGEFIYGEMGHDFRGGAIRLPGELHYIGGEAGAAAPV